MRRGAVASRASPRLPAKAGPPRPDGLGSASARINIVSLWVSAEARGYSTPIWATYRQWADLGAQVRKGKKSSLVIFYKEYDADANPDDAKDDGKRRVARASYVFNASQVDGFALPGTPEPLGPVERIAAADRFIANTDARIEHGGERAFYRPSTDHIQMPDEGLFCGTDTMSRSEGYFATLVHELTHWTSPGHRLARDLGKRFGDSAYAAEELVAEIGSAFLCAELGITQDTRPDHAQYLAHWMKLLKDDSRAIFTAARRRPRRSPTSSASSRPDESSPGRRGPAHSGRASSQPIR
jgi:antirestriction protein ArdC